MARRKNKASKAAKRNHHRRDASYLKITAVLTSVLAAGFFVKIVFSPGVSPVTPSATPYEQPSATYASLEDQVQQVAANFRCACGGCGELPLAECTCDMPRGAREEKDYIRDQLRKGLTPEQVVQRVQDTYGHMNT